MDFLKMSEKALAKEKEKFEEMSKEALLKEKENRVENIAIFEQTLETFPTSSPLGNLSIKRTIEVFKG
jgi:hypothetical protein